jgi:hypothetical protein
MYEVHAKIQCPIGGEFICETVCKVCTKMEKYGQNSEMIVECMLDDYCIPLLAVYARQREEKGQAGQVPFLISQ